MRDFSVARVSCDPQKMPDVLDDVKRGFADQSGIPATELDTFVLHVPDTIEVYTGRKSVTHGNVGFFSTSSVTHEMETKSVVRYHVVVGKKDTINNPDFRLFVAERLCGYEPKITTMEARQKC